MQANSKCPKSFFDESFLTRVFDTVKSNAPQACGQKVYLLCTHQAINFFFLVMPLIFLFYFLDFFAISLQKLSLNMVARVKRVSQTPVLIFMVYWTWHLAN